MTHVLESPANAAAGLIDPLIQSNRGDQQAFEYNGRRYSFHDVAALMNRAGNLLKSWRLPAGAPVLVLLAPSPARVALLLGALKAGYLAVVGDAATEAAALAGLIAQCDPAAAAVHVDRLAALEAALAGKPLRIAVVGGEAGRHVSLVDALREQSSWLAPAPLDAAAPALAWWSDGRMSTLSRAALVEALGGAPAPQGAEALLGMLRAFALGEQTTLA